MAKKSVTIVDINLLSTWWTMADQLMDLTEEQCWALLEAEKAGKARRLFLKRIYGRAARLRGKREAEELNTVAK